MTDDFKNPSQSDTNRPVTIKFQVRGNEGDVVGAVFVTSELADGVDKVLAQVGTIS